LGFIAMMRFLIIFFLLTSIAFARGVLRDSCAFTCTSNVTLVTASTVHCQTPSGSTVWVEDQDTCTGTHQCYSATTNAYTTTTYTNCILMTRPPTSPVIANYDVQVLMTETGTTAAADCNGIYARFTDSTHYYSFMVCDDVTTGGFARLYLQNGTLYTSTTSLGTAAGFGNSYSNVVVLKMRNDKKQVLKDGVQIISSTDNTLTSAGTAGLVCGQAQVSGDDCNTTLRFDNFIIIDQPRRVFNSRLDFIPEARAEEVRDGRWYVSPLVHERGVWQPKIETMKAECSTSNVIDPSKPSVLSYVKCEDYSKLDNDTEIKFIYDEAKKPLDSKAIKMLEGIGKPIDQNFNPLGIYVR
jgi:hypothetical protein